MSAQTNLILPAHRIDIVGLKRYLEAFLMKSASQLYLESIDVFFDLYLQLS